jgi:hypothetical protein
VLQGRDDAGLKPSSTIATALVMVGSLGESLVESQSDPLLRSKGSRFWKRSNRKKNAGEAGQWLKDE